MKYILLSISFLMLIILTPLSANSSDALNYIFKDELWNIRSEYNYYSNKYGDYNLLPAGREQQLLTHIEDKYLKSKNFQQLYHHSNPLTAVANINFAKLLLHYGADPFIRNRSKYTETGYSNRTVLINFVNISSFKKRNIPALTHDEVIEWIKNKNEREDDILFKVPWEGDLPANIKINIIKLYLSLGANIDHTLKDGRNSIAVSLNIYLRLDDSGYRDADEEPVLSPEEEYFIPDEIHRADDIQAPEDAESIHIRYYRSPVTYWLEEFIEAGYPASMLDTHKLHYPRFMKKASVAEVMDMLNNPETHKIPANINCPYQRKQGAGSEGDAPSVQASTELVAQAVSPAELCPLTPSINMRDAMGRTPLHIAGAQGNQAVFDALIQIGADESVKDFRGNVARI